ncbi:hypothetical protein QFC22_002327 [Naganishia vaughanmartiniae]|uniref:Uncharacterized protein n=1 Tax=Naganishia vaughanmartiniae TaxID=1424756 RepID=A0ACC2XEM2_9TREE|nr:hypothetical protein QFC22_002327 [Naganishia vaughanmartiniae]
MSDQYICPTCTDMSEGKRKSTRKTDLPLPISRRNRNVTPPVELSSPEPMSFLDSTFPASSTSVQEQREYSPFPFARPPAAVLPSRSPSRSFRSGSSTPSSPALAPPSPLQLTPSPVVTQSRKRKANNANVQVSRYERATSPEQGIRWHGDVDVQSWAENAEGSGSGGFEGSAVSKKRKSITLKIDRAKVKQSKEVRLDNDGSVTMDDLEIVPEERERNSAKANGKRRIVHEGNGHIKEPATDSHAFKVDFTLPSTRPRPVKSKRKEKDGDVDRLHDYGRRSGGSDNKDTTGDEDAVAKSAKRKHLVSPKIPTVRVKRRPTNPKPRPAPATKASSSAVVTTTIAEDLLAQRGAPEPGPTENAVRGHCVGKLENAFINVFLTFFRALVPNPISGQNRALEGSARAGNLGRNGSMDGDLMEVDPPIRTTEPIVLDHDDIPKENTTTITDSSSANPFRSTDSGTVNPVSSSIEIVTAPHSSQHAIEHIVNGNASQSTNTAGYVNLANGTIDEPRITDDAVAYAQGVEGALFNKLKEFSREKRLWLPGAAYKYVYFPLVFHDRISSNYPPVRQQYNLIISSLEGDLRPDLREGFATRKLSPTEVAAMNSRDLASIERLKEMQVYEEEALKSLVRIDDGKPVKVVKDGADISQEATEEASTSQAFDLDMIIFDVDENESPSTSQLENGTQTSQPHGNGSINLRGQRIPNSRPLSIASPSALPRPNLTAESDLVDGVATSGLPHIMNLSTLPPHAPASLEEDERDEGGDTSSNVLETFIEQYYDNPAESGSVWTATSSRHHGESITEDAFRRARTVWQGENQIMVHRELIIVAFSPACDDEESKADFESLVDFHHTRDRHGRATPWKGVESLPAGAPKEMYLVPLKPDETFDFLDLIPESVLPKVRTENFLLGVFLIAKTGNLLFPPEVLENQLPATTPSRQKNVGTGADIPATSRQGSASATANVEGDQSHKPNGANNHPPPPSDPAPPLPHG